MFARCAARLGAMDLWLASGHDPFGDFFLHDEDICDLAIVTLREQVMSGRSFDELHSDANVLAGPSRAAFDKIGRAQFAADLCDVLGLALVSKG
jgi:hypothetical protein